MKVNNYYGDEAQERILANTDMNAFQYMDEHTRDFGEFIANTYLGTEISYKELKENCYKYANKLKSYGIGKGDCISLCLPNVPEVIYYKYAAWILGAKVNLIDPRTNPEGILDSINRSYSVLVVTVLNAMVPKFKPIMNRLHTDGIVVVSPFESADLKGTIKYIMEEKILKSSIKTYEEYLLYLMRKDFGTQKVIQNKTFIKDSSSSLIVPYFEDKLDATVVFTSGTTGTPKGAVLTHKAYNVKSNQIKYGVPNLNPGDRFLAAIPFFSAYGSFAGMHNCLSKAMNLFMIAQFKPSEFAELVCKFKANTSIGVPKYWQDFAKNYEEYKEKYKLDDLKFLYNAVTGGDEIAPKIVVECNELFEREGSKAKIIVGYGASETGGPVATTVVDDSVYDPKSTGILFPGVDYIFISPETGEIVDENKGELCLADPGMMKGYLDDKQSTDDITIIKNGKKYYKMGDLFKIDEKGRLYFAGRTKRAMMRPDGHTVHATPIEDAIITHEAVNNCCVVGLKRKKEETGSIPTAFVVLNDGVSASRELVDEMDKISLEHLNERNRALAYVFVDSLPYTLMGKVDYKILEKGFIEDLDVFLVDYTFFEEENIIRTRKK